MKKLSIVIPVYNGEATLETCLESISKQTFQDFEIVIVNDGSTDQTRQVITTFFEKHPNLQKQIIDQENKGLVAARNKGISVALGDYIGFVDSDDTIEPDYYELLMEMALEGDYDMVASGLTHHENGETTLLDNFDIPSTITSKEARIHICNHTGIYQYRWNKIFKKEILPVGDENAKSFIGEDFIFMMEVLKQPLKIGVLHQCGYHYWVSDHSQSKQAYNELFKEMFVTFNDYYEAHKNEDAEFVLALERYLVLHFTYILVTMTRNNAKDEEIEKQIHQFISDKKDNYLKNTRDGLKAKMAVQILLWNMPLFKWLTKRTDKK